MTISETELQNTVLAACRAMRLLAYHTHDSRRSAAGFVDLVIVGPAGCLFRELKSATGRLSVEQRAWIDALRAAGEDVDVWRPADLTSSRIGNELAALRRKTRTKAGAA